MSEPADREIEGPADLRSNGIEELGQARIEHVDARDVAVAGGIEDAAPEQHHATVRQQRRSVPAAGDRHPNDVCDANPGGIAGVDHQRRQQRHGLVASDGLASRDQDPAIVHKRGRVKRPRAAGAQLADDLEHAGRGIEQLDRPGVLNGASLERDATDNEHVPALRNVGRGRAVARNVEAGAVDRVREAGRLVEAIDQTEQHPNRLGALAQGEAERLGDADSTRVIAGVLPVASDHDPEVLWCRQIDQPRGCAPRQLDRGVASRVDPGPARLETQEVDLFDRLLVAGVQDLDLDFLGGSSARIARSAKGTGELRSVQVGSAGRARRQHGHDGPYARQRAHGGSLTDQSQCGHRVGQSRSTRRLDREPGAPAAVSMIGLWLMTESEALHAIAKIVEATISQVREVNQASGPTEPSLSEYVEAAPAGVLDTKLGGPGSEGLPAAVEDLCEEPSRLGSAGSPATSRSSRALSSGARSQGQRRSN